MLGFITVKWEQVVTMLFSTFKYQIMYIHEICDYGKDRQASSNVLGLSIHALELIRGESKKL